MTKSIFYHAGCLVCVSTEQDIGELTGISKMPVNYNAIVQLDSNSLLVLSIQEAVKNLIA